MARNTDASTKTSERKAEAEQQAEQDALENQITQDQAEADRIKAEADAASKTPVIDRDEEKAAAHDAEIARQNAQTEAVRETNDQLRQLGGPELNPGNPGHDPETGDPL